MGNIKTQYFLAPMDGYTDSAYRELLAKYSEYRPHKLFTEFVNVEALRRDIKSAQRILHFSPEQKPVIAQLFGKNPDSFYKVSKKALNQGFDGIDINMGCPAKNVAGRDEGAGLIRKPDLALQIIDAVKRARDEFISENTEAEVTISVKTRLGYESDTALDWIGLLDKQGLDFITLHGRTYAQKYSGFANWDRIGEVASKIKTPLVGNGDIESIEQATELQAKHNLFATMIGRNSAIFFGSKNRYELVLEYLKIHREIISPWYFNEEFAYNSSKKNILLLLKGLPNSSETKQILLTNQNYEDSITHLLRRLSA